MQDYTDEMLYERISNEQDRRALEVLYARHWLDLYKFVLAILGREDEAKDCVQEVFISFWLGALSGEKKIADVQAYLKQAVRFQVSRLLRDGRIRQTHLNTITAATTNQYFENGLEAEELQMFVDREVARMPEKAREVFELSRVHHLSNRQIAEELNISVKTVENHLTRALNILRNALKASGGGLLVLIFIRTI